MRLVVDPQDQRFWLPGRHARLVASNNRVARPFSVDFPCHMGINEQLEV